MEKIYNIFLYFEKEVCSTVGYKIHNHKGSEEEKILFLQSHFADDLKSVTNLELFRPFSLSEYNGYCRMGKGHYLYEELFGALKAPSSPLFLTTPVKDGQITIDGSSHHDKFDLNDFHQSKMPDWIACYSTPEGLDIPKLIHDDFFTAIKLTFNHKLYVSAMKLLVSAIDSIAFIEYGDNKKNVFISWIEQYADLSVLGITAEELWEFRNSLLHMTNLSARKIRAGAVRRISCRIGGHKGMERTVDGIFYFDFKELIEVYSKALSNWLRTYNQDKEKFKDFIERYDETISDTRQAFIQSNDISKH